MPNGKPGDHPFTDIVVHGQEVYSATASKLVREIAALANERTQRELGDLLFLEYNEFAKPDIAKLEAVLTQMRDKLLQEAKARGFEL